MNDFARVCVKADAVLKLPRDVAASLVGQGLAEYEADASARSLPVAVTAALLSSEADQATEEAIDNG